MQSTYFEISNSIQRQRQKELIAFALKWQKYCWIFNIFAYNFGFKAYICIKFSQLLYRGRVQIAWKFQVDSIIVAWYTISIVITSEIEWNKINLIRSCAVTLFIKVFIKFHFSACNQSAFHPKNAAGCRKNVMASIPIQNSVQ